MHNNTNRRQITFLVDSQNQNPFFLILAFDTNLMEVSLFSQFTREYVFKKSAVSEVKFFSPQTIFVKRPILKIAKAREINKTTILLHH